MVKALGCTKEVKVQISGFILDMSWSMFFFCWWVKRKGIAKGTMIFLEKWAQVATLWWKKMLRSSHNLNVVVMEIVTTNLDFKKKWLCYLISSQIWFINVLDGRQSAYKWQNWKKRPLIMMICHEFWQTIDS
jgi:hypothetical protein